MIKSTIFSRFLLAHVLIAIGLIFITGACAQGSPKSQKSWYHNEDDESPAGAKSKADIDAACRSIISERPPAPLNSLSELPLRFLDSHNKMRQKYGLANLRWDDELARYAQRWADHLRDNNKCQMQHRSHAGQTEGQQYGENLAWNWTSRSVPPGSYQASPEFSVLGWTKECEDYNYNTTACTRGKMCGHYTQVVWRKTRRVGCGVAVCDGARNSQGKGRAEIWVCNYDPAGNIYKIVNGKRRDLRPF